MKFKNDLEMYKVLVEGKKVRGINWDKGDYLHIKDGWLMTEDGQTIWFEEVSDE